jgi:hypothetical protein
MRVLFVLALVALAFAKPIPAEDDSALADEPVSLDKCNSRGKFCSDNANCCDGLTCIPDAKPAKNGRTDLKHCKPTPEVKFAKKKCSAAKPCNEGNVCFTSACLGGQPCWHGAPRAMEGVCYKPIAKWTMCKMAPINLVMLVDFSSSISTDRRYRQLSFMSAVRAAVLKRSPQSSVRLIAFGSKTVELSGSATVKQVEAGNVGMMTDLTKAFNSALAALKEESKQQPNRRNVLIWESDLEHTTDNVRDNDIGDKVKEAAEAIPNFSMYGAQPLKSGFLWTKSTRETYNEWREKCVGVHIPSNFDQTDDAVVTFGAGECERLYRRFRWEHSIQAAKAAHFLSGDVDTLCLEDVNKCVDGISYTEHLFLLDVDQSASVVEDIMDRLCATSVLLHRIDEIVTPAPKIAAPKCPDAKAVATMPTSELKDARDAIVYRMSEANKKRRCVSVGDLTFEEVAGGWSTEVGEIFRPKALGSHFWWVNNDRALRLGFALSHAGVCIDDEFMDKLCDREDLEQQSDCRLGNKYYRLAEGTKRVSKKNDFATGVPTLWSTRFSLAALLSSPLAERGEYFVVSRDVDPFKSDAERKAATAKVAARLGGRSFSPARVQAVKSQDAAFKSIAGKHGILIMDSCTPSFDMEGGATGTIDLWASNGKVSADANNQAMCSRIWFFELPCGASSAAFYEQESLLEASMF